MIGATACHIGLGATLLGTGVAALALAVDDARRRRRTGQGTEGAR